MGTKIYTHMYFENRVFSNGLETKKSNIKTNFMSKLEFNDDDEKLINVIMNERLTAESNSLVVDDESIKWEIFKQLPDLDAGVVSVFGSGGDGKTTFLENAVTLWNAKHKGIAKLIKFGEPEANSLPNDPAIAIKAIHDALQEYDIVVLDSMKDLILKWMGPLTSGGVSKSPAGWINGLASSCARNNKTIILAINPLTQKEEAISEFRELLISTSTTTIITGDTYSARDGRVGYISRNHQGRDELEMNIVSGKNNDNETHGASMLDTKFNNNTILGRK